MGIMDTRYPAYIVKTGRDGRLINQLRRLEPDRKKGIIVRQESGFGLFGEIEADDPAKRDYLPEKRAVQPVRHLRGG